MNRPFLHLILLSTAIACLACSGLETNLQDVEVSYRETARQNYDAGDRAFNTKQFNQAVKFFEHVKNKFPYSKYAVLADLRVADAHFAREKWLEAADSYRLFTRFHPRHEKVPYATYRVALSYNNDIADDVFLLPPPQEMDQTAAKDAIRAFDDFIKRYPNDENVEEAIKIRTEARTKLAKHDVYAAEFYLKREKWRGAAWRYEYIAQNFADTPLAASSLMTAATLYLDKLSEADKAKPLLTMIVEKYPESEQAGQAKERLSQLTKASSEKAADKKG